MTALVRIIPCLLIFASTLTPAVAQVVTNGSFEDPLLAVPNTTYGPGSEALSGWTISSNSTGIQGIDHVGSLWQAADGNQSISLNWFGPSTISQTLPTSASQLYSLEFSLASEHPATNPTTPTIDVFWNGSLVDSLSFDPSGFTNSNMGWMSFDYILSGTGNDTLSFTSTVAGAFGPALDAISVTAIPACLLGDVDLNGTVDFSDIPSFITILQGGTFQCEADCDQSGVVDFSDIPAFIAILQGA